jgi:hypothetical protein
MSFRRMARPTQRRRGGRSSGNVVRFPPLPRVPIPPGGRRDPRQTRLAAVVESLSRALGDDAHVGTANFTSGFAASAVDLGRLKDLLEGGIARLDMGQVRARWKADVFEWMRRTIRLWVQRCKLLRFRLRDEGIRVEIETQDDAGYYTYGFDVFPGRRRVTPRQRRR